MMNDNIDDIIGEVREFEDNERRLSIQRKVTMGAAVVVALSMLAIKYDMHTNFTQMYNSIENNRRNIESIEENAIKVVPACMDSIEENVYEVRPCSGTKISR